MHALQITAITFRHFSSGITDEISFMKTLIYFSPPHPMYVAFGSHCGDDVIKLMWQ